MNKLKRFLINLSLVITVTVIMLLLCEFVIRALYKDSMVLFPRYTTDVQYGEFTIRRVRPNMKYMHRSKDGNFDFVSNNKGFRNEKDIEYAKKNGEIRVLCLGDSHTLGYEVKQSQVFTSVIEDLSKGKITAINTGVSGIGTAEELVILENEGYKYKPDYVVLGFYDNDFQNNIISKLFKVENDSLVVDHLKYIPGTNIQNFIYRFKIIHFLGENSYLYAYAFNTVWDGIKRLRYRNATAEEKEELTEHVLETREEFTDYEILLMKKLIEEMYTFSKKIEAPLIILDIPKSDLSSSIPQELVDDFRSNSDTLFYANDLKDEFLRLPKVHVPHGHQHISEETHHLFATKILDFINKRENYLN